tara:strand:- start:133 stop:861 length:729 start_codon:yes stop_codon:yes gene_type:complete
MIGILVQSTTRNKKTGNIPTVIVGQNQKDIVSSCQQSGCVLLSEQLGGSGMYKDLGLKPCYAHKSHVSWGTKSIFRAIERGTKTLEDYSIKEGFRMASRHAKYFRLSSIGDCSVLDPSIIDELLSEAKRYQLTPLGYTANPEATHLQNIVLLSCPTMARADAAIKDGWRVAVQITKPYRHGDSKTFTTPDGHLGVICPEQTQSLSGKEITRRNKITCNTCGLCARGNTHTTRYRAIGFIPHN